MGHVLISPVADKQAIKDDIEKILNLNEQNLRVQRYSVWKAIWNKSTKFGKTKPNIQIVHEIINKYSQKHNDEYQPYRGFVIQWFSNRFKKELLAIKKG